MAKRRRWLRWTLVIAAVVLVAAAAAPFLIPLDSFVPRVSAYASAAIGQPVTIAELRLHLLPTPRAAAHGVRIGKADEVRIDELQIVPELFAFLRGERAFRLVSAEKVEIKEAALKILERMPKGGAPVEVRRVTAHDVHLQHSALRLPPFNLEADLGEGLAIESVRLESRDGALKVDLDPEGKGKARVALSASKWRLPLAAAPLLFDSLAASGTLAGKRLELPKIDGKLYGGTLRGQASADWRKLWQVSGSAQLAGIDAAGVQRALGRKAQLTGRLAGSAKFGASARSPEHLAGALALDGPFEVSGGAFHGVDLSRVADLTGSKGEGGTTKFDELRGKLQVRGKRVRVEELCARSSVLVAGGFVEVDPQQKLSGRLGVSIAKTGGFAGVPVALSGTTESPTVRPTRGYTIGAVVGTVLLPGVGTALGGSAGSALEGRPANCK
jgi:hypothetical protein